MFKLTVYNGDKVECEFSQGDYGKVLRFGINALVELMNNGASDFRIDMVDKTRRCYFHVVGPKTATNDAMNRKGF